MEQEHRTEGRARGRHLGTPGLTLLTLGGVMGSGLFLASAQALRLAGPSVLVAYVVGALAMTVELAVLAELSAADPEEGSFLTYAKRSLGPGVAFVTGWIFWFSSILNLAAEATAAATLVRFWFASVPLFVFSMGFAGLVVALNFLPVARFDRVESGMTVVKLVALLGFAAAALGVVLGLLPARAVPGTSAFQPFFPAGLRGVAAAMTVVMFSMSGTGVLGLAAASVRRPEEDIPAAVAPTALAVVTSYLLAAAGILVLTPWRRLSTNAGSPFVAALLALPSRVPAAALNAVLVVSILSAMNAGLFATDRVLYALGRADEAPSFVRGGTEAHPVRANVVSGLLLILAAGLSYLLPKTAFLVLVTATSYQALFIWMVIVASEIGYRRYLEAHRPGDLRFRLPFYPWLAVGEVLLLAAIVATAPLAPHQLPSLGVALGVVGVGALVYWALMRHRRQRAALRTGDVRGT